MAKVIEFYVPKNFGRPLKWAGGCQIRVQYLAERETEGSSAPCPAASTELTQVTQGASTTESYSYDAVGNRLSSSGVPNYSYNASNELTSNSAGSYTYDANGNTLSDPSGKQYTWDFENRLTQAVVPGTNGGTTTFKYDPFGRRIQKSGPLGTTNYLYDRIVRKRRNAVEEEMKGWNVIEEISSTGNVLAQYAQGEGVDEPLAEFRSGTTSYFEGDGVGSVTSLSSGGGMLANTYAYDSFGKLTASTGTLTNPFQYTGREFDQETGNYFYRARYYDQNVGRFVSEDPIRSRGGIDFYAYAGNSPVNYIDPLGLVRTDIMHVPCNEEEYFDCYDRCGSRGVEICEVTWFWKLRRWQPGRKPGGIPTYDWVRGEMNCVCNEPNETCKKLVPGLVPFFIFLEEYGWIFAF